MTITNEQAQEWRELAEAATPGPWEPGVLSIPRDSVISVSENRYVCSVGNGGYWQQDAAFIAAARTAVPALLTERDALAAEVQQLRAQLDAVPVTSIKKVFRAAELDGYTNSDVEDWLYDLEAQP